MTALDGWTDGWRRKQSEDMRALDVAVKTSPRWTRTEIHRTHRHRQSRKQLATDRSVNLPRRRISSLDTSCVTVATLLSLEHPQTNNRGREKLFLSVSQRLTEWDGAETATAVSYGEIVGLVKEPNHYTQSLAWLRCHDLAGLLIVMQQNALIIQRIVEKVIKPFSLVHTVELIINLYSRV